MNTKTTLQKEGNELFDAQRFLDAQEFYYPVALREINSGQKVSHWIWFIFPQLAGLGYSYNSQKYGISDLNEARTYLLHPVLRERLIKISRALLAQSGSAYHILGSPDHLKVCSCMTLFREAAPEIPIFQQVLDKFYNGNADQRSLAILYPSSAHNISVGQKPSREEMIRVFQDTEGMIQNQPLLQKSVKQTMENTHLYTSDETIELPTNPNFQTSIEVTKNRSFQAAHALMSRYPSERVAVLNFASATTPGGGVLTGARAQEESLCRCSTLYPCLNMPYLLQNYYAIHRSMTSNLYSDMCIYTPKVTVVKKDISIPVANPEIDWFDVDVITCAAPNLRHNRSFITVDQQYDIHSRRARRILSIAAARKASLLVLGAFGCGAFQNNPLAVAKAYHDVLDEFTGYYRHVEFAIFATTEETNNYTTFHKIFG